MQGISKGIVLLASLLPETLLEGFERAGKTCKKLFNMRDHQVSAKCKELTHDPSLSSSFAPFRRHRHSRRKIREERSENGRDRALDGHGAFLPLLHVSDGDHRIPASVFLNRSMKNIREVAVLGFQGSGWEFIDAMKRIALATKKNIYFFSLY